MPNSSPLVAIVILNWNGWRDTLECISACRKLEWPNFRILVVDNHSSDGSAEMLRGACPNLEITETAASSLNAGSRLRSRNVRVRHVVWCICRWSF